MKLEEITSLLLANGGCQKCPLAKGRNKIVVGQGYSQAKLVLVGECPGQAEDESGLAFVGRAGQLLTKLLTEFNLTRDEVFITNVCRCRPPNNRTPTSEEIAACLPYLQMQLEAINPKVICALGKTAAVALGLLQSKDSLKKVRGLWKTWNGIPVLTTYHPSYLLRGVGMKEARADFKALLVHCA